MVPYFEVRTFNIRVLGVRPTSLLTWISQGVFSRIWSYSWEAVCPNNKFKLQTGQAKYWNISSPRRRKIFSLYIECEFCPVTERWRISTKVEATIDCQRDNFFHKWSSHWSCHGKFICFRRKISRKTTRRSSDSKAWARMLNICDKGTVTQPYLRGECRVGSRSRWRHSIRTSWRCPRRNDEIRSASLRTTSCHRRCHSCCCHKGHTNDLEEHSSGTPVYSNRRMQKLKQMRLINR